MPTCLPTSKNKTSEWGQNLNGKAKYLVPMLSLIRNNLPLHQEFSRNVAMGRLGGSVGFKCLTLDDSSGRGLRVVRSSPSWGSMLGVELA